MFDKCLDGAERMKFRWMSGVTLEDRKRSEILLGSLGIIALLRCLEEADRDDLGT